MNIDSIHESIIKQLNSGARGSVFLSEDQLDELNHSLLKNTGEQLDKILCICAHSAKFYPAFETNLITLLNSPLKTQTMIFVLHNARKHIVDSRFQRGLRLQFDFLESLKKLLYHSDPEIVEWTLRVIEGCSAQGIYFLKEIIPLKPPFWKWYNRHHRASREIITMLERRWSKK
jgi:hypothetical protein